MKTDTTPSNRVEWAGYLSTQNFASQQPDAALKFVQEFEEWLRCQLDMEQRVKP